MATTRKTGKMMLGYRAPLEEAPLRLSLANVSLTLSAIASVIVAAVMVFGGTSRVSGLHNSILEDATLVACTAFIVAVCGMFQRRERANAVLAAAAALFVLIAIPMFIVA
ncbi:MAG TPA: hypothetical protein VK797_15135 [Tepidisphaeraceae bacterium]|nr:hypothetical protein [Tepidisphaeraceae bacterium]